MASSEASKTTKSAKGVKIPAGTKLAPRTTARKLPWLDGKYSPASPTTPPFRTPSERYSPILSPGSIESPPRTPRNNITTSSPQTKEAPRSFLLRQSTVRPKVSAPTLRRTSVTSTTEHQSAPISANNPSSAAKNRVSHRPHPSTPKRVTVSPVKEETQSPNGNGQLHIARIADNTDVPPVGHAEGPVGEAQLRRGSLSALPSHLEASSTSEESIHKPVQRNIHVASPPHIIKSYQLSPTQPVASSRDIRRLSNAIEGLEDMVQEAVDLADYNANEVQVQEVYEIIEDARNAVREASNMPARNLQVHTSPLKVSESSSSLQNDCDHPMPITHGESHDYRRAPESIDWAYRGNENRYGRKRSSSSCSSSSSVSTPSDSLDRRRLRFSSKSDLLPPQQAQTATRENIGVVLRPSRAQDHSRGRSRRRRGSRSSPDVRRHRHHRVFIKSADRSSHQHHRGRSSSWSQHDLPFDEETAIRQRPSRSQHEYIKELSVRDEVHNHTFSLRRHHRRQPIARNWSTGKKRLTATIACINTALIGIIIGIYAGEVPRIQYMLADESHHVIIGNVVLYFGLAISTFVSWPLPLLHGRKPYILASLALALPLQFPQAMVVSSKRSPKNPSFRTGLLVARAVSGMVLGFANVNFVTVLLDLFGASLQSKNPHQEFVVANDIRRHGGGMGLWLGIWSWCAIGSLAVGFQVGAGIIERLTPDWGFYIIIILLAAALILNVLAPETRRSMYRKSVTEVYDRDENFITRRVARGEIKLHISTEGPKYWFEEVWAGIKLTLMMFVQPGFAVLAFYVGWLYAQIVLVIVLLGALLSRDYKWYPRFVGLGVLSIAIGGLLAIPMTKAGIFSRERKQGWRTDSMTFQKQVTWSSHLVRRVIFTLTLPLMGLAYTVSSAGRPRPYMVPIVFAGALGFLSVLAIAECHGLIMETFDTCDLQPGVNTRHRLQSLAVQDRRRRTNYSSFPRISAGIFLSQTIAFILAAVATEVGGVMTRRLGAQTSTGVTAGILLALTILLTMVLWRWKEVQVIPNHTFGTRRDTKAWQEFKQIAEQKEDWKAVVIGNPSGKMRRMSVLELGGLSRWTEIRKLNFLIRDDKKVNGSWRSFQ